MIIRPTAPRAGEGGGVVIGGFVVANAVGGMQVTGAGITFPPPPAEAAPSAFFFSTRGEGGGYGGKEI